MPFHIRPSIGQVIGVFNNGKFLGTIEMVSRKNGKGLSLLVDIDRSIGLDLNYKKYRPPDPPQTFGDHNPEEDYWYVPRDASNEYEE